MPKRVDVVAAVDAHEQAELAWLETNRALIATVRRAYNQGETVLSIASRSGLQLGHVQQMLVGDPKTHNAIVAMHRPEFH